MATQAEDLKAHMMAEAEAVIDRLLAGAREPQKLTLTEIEQLVRAAGQAMMERFTGDLAEEAAKGEEDRTCPACGGKARYKGQKERPLVTETGEVRVKRGYYYCPDCRKGFFPLDRRWGLNESIYSPGLACQMVWASGLVAYNRAQEVLERIGHYRVPTWSVWRQARQHGARLKAYEDRQQERVGVERVMLPPPGRAYARRQGVSMDGGMVHIRGEGWKEMKVGTVYDVELRLERDPETHDLVERAHGVKMAYTAVLGSAEQFSQALWALAWRRGLPMAGETSVTADGAEWIWGLAADLFPTSVQIVDWYHACQHLSEAAQAMCPGDEAATRRWYRQHCADLYKGDIHRITQPLDRAGLSQQAHYFHTHKRRMQYQQRMEEGYPIGSGTVESGIKQFKTRLTGAGMRWSRPGAEQMLVIRGAIMEQRFDALWKAA